MGNHRIQKGSWVAPEYLWVLKGTAEEVADGVARAEVSATALPSDGLHIRLRAVRQRIDEMSTHLGEVITNYSRTEAVIEAAMAGSVAWEWVQAAAQPNLFGVLGFAESLALGYLIEDRAAFNRRFTYQMEAVNLTLGSALTVLGDRGLRAFSGTIRLDLSAPERVSGPGGISDLAARVPGGTQQIRVERYGSDQHPRFVVYLGGTIAGHTATQPFSALSDVQLARGVRSASQAAVEQAMRSAGVTSNAPVMMVGYSQGGMVAQRIAESGSFQVVQNVTFGTPHGIDRESIRTLAIQNAQDPVWTAGGVTTHDNRMVTFTADSSDTTPTRPFDPHRISEYQRTAADVDSSRDPDLVATRARVRAFTSGGGSASGFTASISERG